MTNESVDYAETVNLFNVSMGKGLEGLNQYYEKAVKFQNDLQEKLGVNIAESMNYQALFNSMSKSMGISAKYAYTLSENFTKLGYDLASLYNIDPENAMQKLRAGLAGQTKPLRDLGLDITQQSLQPIVDSLGIDRSVKNMSQAEKMILRYIAVLKQAQIAQGDFANTMDSPANQLRIFNAQVVAFKRNMGNLWQGFLGGILPYVNAIMMVINELLKMVAKLFGFKVSEQKVNISASIGADDLASDLGNAGKKAKELKAQLMGFDEINNITLPDSPSGSGGASIGGIDQRLLNAMKEYDNLMDKVKNKATDIRDKMMEWLGFVRNDDGTWRLKEGLTNFEKILDVVKTIGVALGTWKVASTVTKLLKNLGVLGKGQSFQLAFGLTLLATGIFAQYKGTKHLLNGDIDLFTLLETFLGTAGGAFGIVNILKATKLGKTLSLGNKLKAGFGIMLGIQGVQVFLDGIKEGDIKKTILGALEGVTSLSIAFNGLFGKKLITSIKNTAGSIATFGIGVVKSFKDARASGLGLGKSFLEAGSCAKDLIGKGAGVVAELAGITAGSALSYATMKDLTTGEIGATEGALKLAGGLGVATASGALAGSQFGLVGAAIGGIAGLTTSAITAFMGYKDGIESLNIPTTTLTGEIKNLTEEIDNNRKAHEQNVKSIKDTYENQLVEAEYADRLAQQLNGLVDANGKVKAGNEERVKFILGELNNALGTEYELNGNLITKNGEVVDSYNGLQDSIKATIEAKKKEAEQTAITELYKESIKQQIKLERERAKAKEEYAKAEKEYDDLMAKGLSNWTLEHDENCKQIMQNLIDTSNAYCGLVDECEKSTGDVSYYSQKMTDSMIENTGKLSTEMVTQGQVSSEQLKEMVNTNTKSWEETYNALNVTQQSAMLAQSTSLDKWSPIIEEKWKDMAKNSAQDFLNGISQVDTKTQEKILSTVTTTGNMTPELATAWKNLASKSYDDYSAALNQVDETTRLVIETITNTTSSLSPTQIQKWANLAKNDKRAYENNLTGLDETTRQRVQSCVDAVNNKQWTAEEASKGLARAVERGVNTIDTTEAGKQAVNGVAEGINKNKNSWSLWDSLRGLKNTVVGGIKSLLGIHSPSTVMRDMIGRYIPLGIAEGIDSEAKSVYKSMSNLTDGIMINPQDFAIDTNQFIDYEQISGAIQAQSNISVDNNMIERMGQACYNAFVNAMRTEGVKADIEVRADEGIIVKKASKGFNEYVMQTGELPFTVPVN